MTRLSAALSRWVGAALIGAAHVLGATPASADTVFFGYQHGPAHPFHHPHYRPWGPPVVFGPPVILVPPPRVVYLPSPYVAAPIPAVPASAVYQTADGRYCRAYQATVVVGGIARPSYGTACLQPDGAWRIVY
jgi:hypothetical protein